MSKRKGHREKKIRKLVIKGNLLSRPGRGEDELERGIAALGMTYERQAHIKGFYVDFLIKPYKIVVEVDGPGHNHERDAWRQQIIESAGYRVVRVQDEYAQSSPLNAAKSALLALSEFETEQYKRHRKADFDSVMESI